MNELRSRALLARLVGFATVSRDSNLALVGFVRQYLADLGVECELIYNSERTKANLLASIGPLEPGGVVLSGHTDVVPVDGQAWTVDPFCLSEADGKLFGRGTADMKGYLASVLAAVPMFLASPLRRPVHLAFSYDEEVGCLGVRSLLETLPESIAEPALCLIGEPTQLQPVLGHKGKLAMRCHVRGTACHSAYAPHGVNAIEQAARLIGRLGEIGAWLADPARHDPRFDPAYSTVQVGVIQGGTALNIVPADCRFDFEIRALPDFAPQGVVAQLQGFAEQTLLPAMQAVNGATAIRFEQLSCYPGLATSPKSAAARLVAQLCGSDAFGTVAFGTEGGLFDQAGIPTVVCGPGSMDQGHKPDEYVSVEQMAACDRMMDRLARHLSEPHPFWAEELA
ncbi:acetylornithine deacetylase [Pseudomonas sp. NFACC36]|uniref:acetylornithine deacetylase n=1 Tax=Pseudomonas sp. NFACC36 TaxID=1566197 RepID=UPI0009247022|nr:acetylornithine deacetylase [Pseudomonas sp. NFACC36]SFY24328.1 acetylornithine deacetylase [Pseudomonas sp. NFACC36]